MAKKILQILIADDDLDDLELLEEALMEHKPNAIIKKATGGRAAIDLLNAYPDSGLPSLIVLDYNMPDIPGSEVLAYLGKQQRYHEVPRVVFSTSNAQRHVSECLNNGATKYFVKPNTKQELEDVTQQMLSLITEQQ